MPEIYKFMFGAVQWIDKSPILDGMIIFSTKKECVKYITLQEKHHHKIKGIIVTWTIIRLEKK